MPLPPIDESPALVVRFTSKATERLIMLCQSRWKESGLVILHRHHRRRVQPDNNNADTSTILVMTTTQKALEDQAERLHLMKRTNDTNVMEYFSKLQKHRFRQMDKGADRHLDQDGVFTSRDRFFLTDRIFKSVTVLKEGEKVGELSLLLENEFKANYRLHLEVETSDRNLRKRLEEHGEKSDTLWHVLVSFQLVDLVSGVHQPALRDLVVAKTTLAPFWNLSPNVTLIQDYFGYEVGFYFAWIGFLSRWYFFPGMLGLFVYGFRLHRGDTIDHDEYTPFYGLICFVWAILFLRFWEREENRLAYQWGTYSLTNYERQKFFATRPEFRGFLRLSPVTGDYETYFPPFRRRLRFVVSALVTIFMLGIAFTVMILSLNLQGYINPNHNAERWNDKNGHPFHFPTLAVLAEEGNLLDHTSQWRSLIPVVAHVLCISTLNGIYRRIAEALTQWENHETELNHTNSVVVKRFLFEAFDCYVALFYLAFYERNVDRLRSELVGVFQIDTLRRVLLECIVPMLLQSYKHGHFVLPQSWHSFTHRPATLEDILEDMEKDVYEQFDDYMEMVIQLGYVTLFASAYPLASMVAIFANWAEIRTDALKIARLCRRPDIHRAAGIGTWRYLMASIVWMSALTNCLITGFTSDQLMHYFPTFFLEDDTGYTDMGHERGWIAVFVIFGLEHVLLVTGVLIYAIVPAVPEDVQDELERRQFLRMKEHDAAVHKLKEEKND